LGSGDGLALAQSIQTVSEVANDIGSLRAVVSGGRTSCPPELEDHNATEEAA